jgi:hypothetical protein
MPGATLPSPKTRVWQPCSVPRCIAKFRQGCQQGVLGVGSLPEALAGSLAPAPTRPATSPPRTRPKAQPHPAPRTPRPASAAGTDDDFCHLFVGPGRTWRYTLCGQRLKPPQTIVHDGAEAGEGWVCPGGHPSCPECIAISRERGAWS